MSVLTSDGLEAERLAARRLVDDLRTELAGILGDQEANPPDDEHDIDGSSVGYERARVLALLAAAERQIEELDAVADRIAEGSYGRCEQCRRPIPEDRLTALPTARCCFSCAAALTTGTVRPTWPLRSLEPMVTRWSTVRVTDGR